MQQRKLGQLGTPVSAVGYGAMSFTDFYGPATEEGSEAVLARCIDLGITHIDTSNAYGLGKSESRIGAFLAKQGKQAQSFFKIATKAGITRDPEGKRKFDNSPEHLRASLDASLERLGVEQVELFYVHRRDSEISIEEVTGTLAELIKSGKTLQVGFSEIAPTQLSLANAVHPIGAVQSEYSLSTRSPEMGLVQRTKELGTTLVAFSPIGRALLTDSPIDYETCQTLDFMKVNPRFLPPNHARNIEATAPFRALAAEMGHRTSSLAIAWLLNQDEHILPIPGTRSIEHLNELAAGANIVLTESDLKAIEEILPIGWCHGDRYAVGQWVGPEKFC